MKIDGMVALVTGAAMGIGKAICQMLLENGAKGVCLVDLVDVGHRTAAELASKYGDGRTIFVKADVTNKEQLEAAFVQTRQQFGRLDIVASNAGVMTEVNYEMMINVNL
ncbi:PREDICTED: 15-hydroxyprostaglandin dehydrogenase [NAD(+)]-like, partial [Priapulus caudatus]|uniref:15-hydroxyprostaglandin dehydrogenase [NAD(+)] n=1 Tax=Priapulus caudatus TaxID=37621 RepID=A0ABM1ETF5_PRICU